MSSRFPASARALVVGAVACTALFVTADVARAQCFISIAYQGISTVHLTYYSTTSGHLVVRRGGATADSVLEKVTVSGAETHYRDLAATPLAQQRYAIVGDGRNGKEEYCARTVTLSNYVTGTLTADDLIEGDANGVSPVFLDNLIIRANMTLRVTGSTMHWVTVSSPRLGNGILGGSVILEPGGGLVIADSRVRGLQVADASPSFLRVTFGAAVDVAGGAPRFIDSDFLSSVSLLGRTAAEFNGNVFLSAMLFRESVASASPPWKNAEWYEGNGPDPIISDNSFLAGSALFYYTGDSVFPAPPVPIEIGPNYYGDVGGPQPRNSLWGRGASVTWDSDCGGKCPSRPAFRLAPHLGSGRFRSDRTTFPRFWVAGFTAGQNTLDHSNTYPILRQGRETLLSAEIVTDDPAVSGVDVYVMLDGKRVDPTSPGMVIHRDSARYGRAAYARATITHNFILPRQQKDTAKVELWLDASRATGYSGRPPAPQLLLERTLSFGARLARKFRVCVRPTRVALSWTKGTLTSAPPVIASIERQLPAMIPVALDELEVKECAAIDLDPGLMEPRNAGELIPFLALQGYVADAKERHAGLTPADVSVLVVEKGLLGGDGANQPGLRRAVLVDEGRPDAFVHELGHAAGLYPIGLNEQYDQHPPYGLPVKWETAFSPEGPYSTIPAGDQGRIYHVVGPDNWTYDPNTPVIDIMGDGSLMSWPSVFSARAIGSYIATTTGIVGTPVSMPSRAAAPLAPGTKRVLVTSQTEKTTVQQMWGGAVTRYRLRRGTTRAVEAGPDGVVARPPAPEDAGDPCAFDALDANNAILASVHFGVVNSVTEHENSTIGFWAATFDVPDSAVFFRIRTQGTGDFPIAVYDAALSTRLTAPAPGAVVGPTLRVAWQDAWTSRAPSPIPEWVSVQPLQHQLEYSVDGVSWRAFATPVGAATETTVPTSLLPGGTTVSLRLVVSDGLRRAVSQVDGLVVPRRPPGVKTLSPRSQARGTPSTEWRLDTLAWDDDGTPVTTTWSSDRDGALGSGRALTGVRLTAGTHRLTCRAVDGDGQATEEHVTVEVVAAQALDLAIPAESLSIAYAAAGPVTPASPPDLVAQRDYRAAIRLRAPGVETTATLRLYLTAPGASEVLLAQQTQTVDAFGDLVVTGPFTSGGDGEYVFRAELVSASPNADTFNDARTWRFALRTPTPSPGDTDGDGLPDDWESRFGLNPGVALGGAGAAGDPDGDGVTNSDEYQQGTHPRGAHVQYFAEGAVGGFFGTRLALANPGSQPALALLHFLGTDGSVAHQSVAVPPTGRSTVDVGMSAGTTPAEFSTTVESDEGLVIDRTMTWGGSDAATRYGGHAERGIAERSATWYLAEGATHGGFDLFYLLQNPSPAPVPVKVRYLLPAGAPLEKSYTLPPTSRRNIWVNHEQFEGIGKALANTDVSAVIETQNGTPITVERAMYLSNQGRFFNAGHESVGVTAPATEWFLAEGATGPYFDLFILIANPTTTAAQVEVTYLLPDGSTLVKPHQVGASSRFNIWVDYEDARLADTAVSTTVRSTNGVPLIVERAMWWPGGPTTWHEAHNSAGATTTGTRWGLAEGEVDTSRNLETYILVANTSSTPADVKVTLVFEDGTQSEQTFAGIPGRSRFNVPVGHYFPAAAGKRFGAILESVGPTPAQIVVERAMYWDAVGQRWAAGTNALATKLR